MAGCCWAYGTGARRHRARTRSSIPGCVSTTAWDAARRCGGARGGSNRSDSNTARAIEVAISSVAAVLVRVRPQLVELSIWPRSSSGYDPARSQAPTTGRSSFRQCRSGRATDSKSVPNTQPRSQPPGGSSECSGSPAHQCPVRGQASITVQSHRAPVDRVGRASNPQGAGADDVDGITASGRPLQAKVCRSPGTPRRPRPPPSGGAGPSPVLERFSSPARQCRPTAAALRGRPRSPPMPAHS